MRAYRFTAWQQPPELADVPVPEPGPGEVLVKVAGCGVCHSDLHVMEWPEGVLPWPVPFTLGHEPAGWVEAVGDGVAGVAVGEAVLVYGPLACGRCRRCAAGAYNYCERSHEVDAAAIGLGRDGGMAEHVLVPSPNMLVALGDLDPVTAAPLADAALTPYAAIKASLHRLAPGSTAVVIGVGGLGHAAVQVLKAVSSARVVAVDVDEAKLQLAREVGADVAVTPTDVVDAVGSAAAGAGADLVLDIVGSDATLALAAQTVANLGHVSVLGIALGTLPFSFMSLPMGASIGTSYWGSIPELLEVVALARSGSLGLHVERFPLERAADAYDAMRDGALRGRAVIVP